MARTAMSTADALNRVLNDPTTEPNLLADAQHEVAKLRARIVELEERHGAPSVGDSTQDPVLTVAVDVQSGRVVFQVFRGTTPLNEPTAVPHG